jgi:hypothetical protein
VVRSRPEPSRITRENFDRITPGMSRTEVEAILGPPGDYRTRLGEWYLTYEESWNPDLADYDPKIATWHNPVADNGEPFLPVGWSWGIWKSDSIMITIVSDDAGRVKGTEALARRSRGSPLDNPWWRIKRQWHRWFPE